MSKFGSTRHTRQLRTTVDPRRPFDAQLLETLAQMQESDNISESRAVMLMLWHGWHAYTRPGAPSLARKMLSSQPGSRSTASRAAKPMQSVRRSGAPSVSGEAVDAVAPIRAAVSVSPPEGAPSLTSNITASQSAQPASSPGGALTKLRNMAISHSVIPVDAAEPDARSATHAAGRRS